MDQREIVLYTRNRSFRCWQARRFLRHRGYRFEIVDTTDDPNLLIKLSVATHHRVMPPYIFVDHRPVGNLGVIKNLSNSGSFEHLLRDQL